MAKQLEEIIEEYGDYLLRVAYLYVKDLTIAEDIVQDVFIAFYKKQSQFKGNASLKTYLVKITVNRCHDYLRSWKRKRLILMDKMTGKGDSRTPEYLVLEAADTNASDRGSNAATDIVPRSYHFILLSRNKYGENS